MAKAKFERTKPHCNIGTIGHVDHGKTIADGRDHQDPGRDRRRHVHRLRPDRQGARGARARHLHRARRVRDQGPPLRPRRLSLRRLRQEHDPRGRRRWTAPSSSSPPPTGRCLNARAHPAGAPGRRAGARRLHEQGRHGRRQGRSSWSRWRCANSCRATSSRATTSPSSRARPCARWRARTGDRQGVGARADEGGRRPPIPQPDRPIDQPFLMPIEDVFSISGRGTVVTRRIERGVIKVGEEVEIVGIRDTQKSTVTERGDVPQAARSGRGGRQRRLPVARHRPRGRMGAARCCASRARSSRTRSSRPRPTS